MKKKGLYLRATSIQHTALALKKVKKHFIGSDLDILTHAHAVDSLKCIALSEKIIPFPYKESFSVRKLYASGLHRALLKEKYNFVVIPIENMSGVGYENVLAFAVGVRPQKIFLCDKLGGLKKLTIMDSLTRLFTCYFFYPIATVLSFFLMIKWLVRITIHGWRRRWIQGRDYCEKS